MRDDLRREGSSQRRRCPREFLRRHDPLFSARTSSLLLRALFRHDEKRWHAKLRDDMRKRQASEGKEPTAVDPNSSIRKVRLAFECFCHCACAYSRRDRSQRWRSLFQATRLTVNQRKNPKRDMPMKALWSRVVSISSVALMGQNTLEPLISGQLGNRACPE